MELELCRMHHTKILTSVEYLNQRDKITRTEQNYTARTL
jgi:hypothetical protein